MKEKISGVINRSRNLLNEVQVRRFLYPILLASSVILAATVDLTPRSTYLLPEQNSSHNLTIDPPLSLSLVRSSHAEENIDSNMIMRPLAERVLLTENWWPMAESTALRLNLPRLHDDNWPAELYDRIYRSTGRWSNIQEQAAEKANFILRNQPETVNSAGYCLSTAIVQLLEDPQVFPGENWFGVDDPKKIRAFKEGLLVLKHSGHRLILLQTNPDNPEVTTRNLLEPVQKGRPVLVDYPANMGSGRWYRPLLGINPEEGLVRVTNFGQPNIDLPIRGIRSAYMVYMGPSDVSFNSALPDWSFYKYENLDIPFINRLVYGTR